jgi:hypothetical protein
MAEVTGVPFIDELGFPFPIVEFPSKSDMSDVFVPLG